MANNVHYVFNGICATYMYCIYLNKHIDDDVVHVVC